MSSQIPTAATTIGEPEEVLIADPRGALTPAQMVDHKLLALLPTSNPGLFIQADGRQDIRRIPPGADVAHSRFEEA